MDVEEFFSKPEELGERLTQAGLELENLENLSESFHHVLVGCVEKLERHPQADRLTLCQVDVGEGNLRQIVCGAQNHKQGDKVVVALPGACLPGGFSIKKSKIRGVESLGMMCSDSELGQAEKSEGIKILPQEAKVGTSYAEYAGLDDVVFELNVTPNRADCLSHVGLARELACILGRKVREPKVDVNVGTQSTKKVLEVELKSPDLCPRYAGRLVTGIKVGESPQWMKARLEAVGINPINNVVDVTNYVMLELGQPLHAFDREFIQGQKIIIDRAIKGEKFTTLDGTEVELTSEELTIRDSERAVALAGIVGGLNSGVVDQTKDIFIESAHFTQNAVRRTSRQLGIETDSAYRFARGTDPQGVEYALRRACHLMEQLTGGDSGIAIFTELPTLTPSSRLPF